MTTKTPLLLGTFLAASLFVVMNVTAAATPASMTVGGKTYYKVTSTDATQDSGKEVCALVGKACVGYTNLSSNAVCKAFNPTAKTVTSVNGSKAGFYCNGAPQKGLACEKAMNTCQVCPACNVNADCTTAIGGQFREMYVECGAAIKSSAAYVKPPLKKSSSSRSAGRSSSSRSVAAKPIGPYPGNLACDFYQGPGTTKKVTCNAIKAADSFCAIAMQSRFAKAVECNDNGRIICTKPCVTNPREVMLKQCAFDAKRPKGSQAAPFNYCTTGTSSSRKQSSSAAATKKKAGAICNHGGDCISGKCIGTGRPNNQPIYQCSCSWSSLTYGCD